ncbi:MAG TPA: ImmA/IrrE family metallo-endopeptidase [Anaerolineaceae bacterium]|nr:ImmA/IrrE family metallo-endopeptidase [Anaerolineaceae bacterium]
MTDIVIASEVFHWARRRAGYSEESLAKSIHIKPETILAWETGKKYPNLKQAQKLATALSIPFGYLFLSQPPQMALPIADFRTLPGKENEPISPNLQEVLDDALRKRDWYAEWRKAEGLAALEFVGKYNIWSPPEEIIRNMRQVLSISPDFASQFTTWDEHLRQLIQKVESAGILVLQSGIVGNNTRRKLSLNEFRGFTLADEFAPLIFLNAQDSIAARIFTLVHELAHLWTGTSGISNVEVTTQQGEMQVVERFCNKIAAEFLVPQQEIFKLWKPELDPIENVQALARRFRVSAQAVLQRGYETGLVSADEYHQAYQEIINSQKVTKKGPGGNFYNTLFNRNSRRFTRELLFAVSSGQVSFLDGARLLNTHPGQLVKAMDRMG